MKSATALLALAASVNASPLLKRQDDNGHVYDNVNTMCKDKASLLGTPEGAAAVWKDTTAGNELDIAIAQQWQHEVNWLKNLEDRVVGGVSGAHTTADCGVTDGECNILGGKTCDDIFATYGADKDGNDNVFGKTSYWIFKAVKGLQIKFRMLKTDLTAQTMVTGFSIDSMVSDFQGNEDATGDVLKWLSAAIGLGETVAGLVPGISSGFETAAGILGGVFDMVAEEVKPEEIDTATISSALVGIFEKATEKIDNTLMLAVGGADNVEAFNALPDPTGGDPWYKSPVAKFFSTGWFLLDNDSVAVKNAIDSITNNIKPKLANNVMKAANLRLVADKRPKDREACGYATGRQWMALREGEEYCFYIMRFNPSGLFGGSWTEATEDIYEKMASYNLGNRDPFYRGVIDCALSANKELNVDNLGFNGIPVCFFDLEAWFIDTNDDPSCNSPMPNKSCNPVKTDPIM